MSTIAELFGVKVAEDLEAPPAEWTGRHCPFTDRVCDVTANRSDRAHLHVDGKQLDDKDRKRLLRLYGSEEIPLAICSVMTQRQNEQVGRPWIVCPKRLLELRTTTPRIPESVRKLIPIADGTWVRGWWEVKFRRRDPATSAFFEYTFDYLLLPFEPGKHGEPDRLIGPPYVLEIMTSSTRGGGLTEHMVDALALRAQRPLRGAVKSPYTPNYRQVFERMLGQLIAKSEIAEKWGGRTIWLLQDVLLDYIEQTTSFRASDFEGKTDGNVFVEVFKLKDAGARYELVHDRSLRGPSRTLTGPPDFTEMLGLGFAPKLSELFETLSGGTARRKDGDDGNSVSFRW